MNIDNMTSGLQTDKTTPEHRILGGVAVAFILGSIMAVIIIMFYAAWFS